MRVLLFPVLQEGGDAERSPGVSEAVERDEMPAGKDGDGGAGRAGVSS